MSVSIKYILFILIIVLYLVSRLYRLEELYTFSFDQYRDAWEVKKIIVDKKLTLIGPQSSYYGIFYGPLFFYLLVPFYWITNLSPLGGAYAAVFFGLTTLILLYFIGTTFFSSRVGIIASLIYVFSLNINLLNRNCRNDPPLMSFSLILLLFIWKIFKSKKKDFKVIPSFFLGLIAGLGFHFHFSAVVFPLLLISSLLIIKKRNLLLNIISIAFGFLFALLPLFIFDYRHSFIISRAFMALSADIREVSYINNFYLNIILFMHSLYKIIVPEQLLRFFKILLLLTSLIFIFIFLYKRIFKTKIFIFKIMILWIFIPLIIFSFYIKQSNDYYYLMNFPVFILFFAACLEYSSKNKLAPFVLFFLGLMFIVNLEFLPKIINNRNLTLANKAIEFIKNDSSGKPVTIDYLSTDNFKVGFEYLVYYYRVSIYKDNSNSSKYRSYTIFVPASKNKDLYYKAVFGDIGINILYEKSEN